MQRGTICKMLSYAERSQSRPWHLNPAATLLLNVSLNHTHGSSCGRSGETQPTPCCSVLPGSGLCS
jgi:hypothetical protein